MVYLVICIAVLGEDSLQSLGLRYTDFISPQVKGMQELAEKNRALSAENNQLKQQIQILKEKETAFSARLEKMDNLVTTGDKTFRINRSQLKQGSELLVFI